MKTYLVNNVECILVGVAFDETTVDNTNKYERLIDYVHSHKVITRPALLDPVHHKELPFSVVAMDCVKGCYYKGVLRFCLPLTEIDNFLKWRKTQDYRYKQPYRTGENPELDKLFDDLTPWTLKIQDI